MASDDVEATDDDVDTSRARVQTYVPEYQKREWQVHADDLDMSLSEFVRSMVQAGRRGFEPESIDSESDPDEAGEGPSSGADPRGLTVEDRVVAALSEADYLDWDELVDAVVDDVEAEVDQALQELQAADRVVYSGRNGGYTLA